MFKKAVVLILVVSFLLTACTPAAAPAPAPAQPAAATQPPAPAAAAATAAPAAPAAGGKPLNFYWISHGGEGDPIWIFAVNGANAAAKALGVNVKTSFHHGDIASQKEAFKAAIAANADGIAVSSPQAGVLNDEVKLAKEKGIPVVFLNTDDPQTGRAAYVGADLGLIGRSWAQYLVDNKLVKSGDKVWLPVEVPGATYGVDETKGIASVFDPLGIKYEVFDAKYDPVETLQNQTDYLTAHGKEIAAVIGLGDMVTGNLEKAFKAAGIKPGQIPAVGWGNSSDTANAVKNGYVNAATWQYPDSQGFMPIVLLYMIKNGMATGYDIHTSALYTKDNVDTYIKLTDVMKGGAAAAAPAEPKKGTFYWISHGGEGDPIWIFAVNGANAAAKALGVNVKTSFHHGDIASQKEAFKAAIAAGADGIAVSSPQAGVLNDEVKLAKEKGIPVIFLNTDDPQTGRAAYVGADLGLVGQAWAQYLVDNKLVKSGDKVWLPVEVPGATYGVDETKAAATVLDPAGVKYEVFDAKYDPVETLQNQTDYLTAHGKEIAAVIGLGDMVTGNLEKAFKAAGIKPGQIPVVGWGNSSDTATAVKDGYVNAATWQYPDSQGFMPIVLLYMMKNGMATGYNIYTSGLYNKDNVDTYIKLTDQMTKK
jgi:simple sugar transport system substrate-binding protein